MFSDLIGEVFATYLLLPVEIHDEMIFLNERETERDRQIENDRVLLFIKGVGISLSAVCMERWVTAQSSGWAATRKPVK